MGCLQTYLIQHHLQKLTFQKTHFLNSYLKLYTIPG